MTCPMRSGRGWSRCCPGAGGRAGCGTITGRWSTGSCSGPGPGARGGTCPASTAPGRPCTGGTDGTWDKILGRVRRGRGRGLVAQRGFHGAPGAPARCGAAPGTAGRAGKKGPDRMTRIRSAPARTWILAAPAMAGMSRPRPLLSQIRIVRPGPGRPSTRPGAPLADKAYSPAATRDWLRRHQIRAVIPERQEQMTHRTAARLRRRPVQGPLHPGAVLQQAQAIPRRRHPVRQAAADLRGHHRRRVDPDLAPRPSPMNHETGPSDHGTQGAARVRPSAGRSACCPADAANARTWS